MKTNVKKILICLMIFILATTSVFANQLDDAKDDLGEIQRKRKEKETKIKELNKLKTDTERYLKALDDEITKCDEEILSLSDQIISVETEIQATQEELAGTKLEEENQYNLMKKRIQYMYEAGETDFWDVVAGQDSIIEMFNNIDYQRQIAEYDRGILTRIEELRTSIEFQEAKLEENKANLEKLYTAANDEKKQLDTVNTMKSNELTSYNSEITNNKAAIAKLEKEEKELEEHIKRIEAMSTGKYDGGQMLWPLNGYTRISSKFGYRTHPIYGNKNLHTGVDIPAPYGTPIHAAYSGKVVVSQWQKSYGNYIMIDHGSGYFTLYAHASKLVAKVGDIVKTGDVIAKVGSTGDSTGNHLHFSFRINGKYVEPTQYLLKK